VPDDPEGKQGRDPVVNVHAGYTNYAQCGAMEYFARTKMIAGVRAGSASPPGKKNVLCCSRPRGRPS